MNGDCLQDCCHWDRCPMMIISRINVLEGHSRNGCIRTNIKDRIFGPHHFSIFTMIVQNVNASCGYTQSVGSG